jgi:hypothetical protein
MHLFDFVKILDFFYVAELPLKQKVSKILSPYKEKLLQSCTKFTEEKLANI